ncbi:MAG: amidoligase family protein [Thiohalocapsa sp. PB-PSB1]|jgi:hypothetical protein|nr:MAG: amidoligase family protein [Thiohalocapsa sp. PB-PSB1]
MSEQPSRLPLPPRPLRADGEPRRIGVEIEFGGLSVDETTELVADQFGGDGETIGRYERQISGDPAGPWSVELDFTLLKELGRRERDREGLAATVESLAEETLRQLSEPVVPVEVVSPPLPMSRLGEVEQLIGRLREAGARGTGDELIYVFGMQLNPELPDTDVDTARQYLQAFLCLEDWLRERAQVDLARRLTLFADPFPKNYIRTCIDPGYTPNRDRLIDDYLQENPTRNRALDMLPLFTHWDAQRVQDKVDDRRVKARPTLHYRLPNCEIDKPGWGLATIWADWLVLERLATDAVQLGAICRHYATFLDRPLARLSGNWLQECEKWLRTEGLL